MSRETVTELRAIRKLLTRLVLVNERLAAHLGVDTTVKKSDSAAIVDAVPKTLTADQETALRRSTGGPMDDTGLYARGYYTEAEWLEKQRTEQV